jgi:N-acetyl-anhydromuramyl-L-alanine amidase AmpD
VCWDRDLFIVDGFTPGNMSELVFGLTRVIRSIVWHDMEGFLDGAIKRWNTGAAGAHLCILQSGEVVRTVRLEDVAWHAGTHNSPNKDGYGRTPFWRSHNINAFSVGIEIEGFLTRGYNQAQAEACRRVSDWLTHEYQIERAHTMDAIDGHHAHGELSSSRTDPGPMFDWSWVL